MGDCPRRSEAGLGVHLVLSSWFCIFQTTIRRCNYPLQLESIVAVPHNELAWAAPDWIARNRQCVKERTKEATETVLESQVKLKKHVNRIKNGSSSRERVNWGSFTHNNYYYYYFNYIEPFLSKIVVLRFSPQGHCDKKGPVPAAQTTQTLGLFQIYQSIINPGPNPEWRLATNKWSGVWYWNTNCNENFLSHFRWGEKMLIFCSQVLMFVSLHYFCQFKDVVRDNQIGCCLWCSQFYVMRSYISVYIHISYQPTRYIRSEFTHLPITISLNCIAHHF